MTGQRSKQYGVIAKAGSDTPLTSFQAIPTTPGRVFLFIQNTGANPGLVQITNAIKFDNSNIILTTGQTLLFDKLFPDGSFNGPTEAINFGSKLGTTFAVIEGVANG